MEGSTLLKLLREFVAACDAAFWLAKFVVAAGGDWPRFPFCYRGIVAASFSFSRKRRALRCVCVSVIFAARVSEAAKLVLVADSSRSPVRDVARLGDVVASSSCCSLLVAFL